MLRTRHAFEQELAGLKQDLLKMSAFVEGMLDRAMRALVGHDVNLAKQVVLDDDTADALDLEIEQHCMRLLALQQPMSRDLRTIGTVMKVIADVERIADYCVDIARAAITLGGTEYFKPLVDLPRMAQIVADMLRTALQALVHEDLALVDLVAARDDEVDDMWKALLEELIRIMAERPEVVPQAVQLLLVARYLERIADHVVNIAERAAYMVSGEFTQLTERHKETVVE